jgi:glycosyltransferase involved in cell wall biosynthesis
MRILGLSSFPTDAAATRFRMTQYVEPLRKHGVELTVEPFMTSAQFRQFYESGAPLSKLRDILGSLLRRFKVLSRSRRYDALIVQREAMFFGPAVFEWLFQHIGNLPMILDLDDATYLPYLSPKYGHFGNLLKFFGKTDNLIKRSRIVICGNRFIAQYVESKGSPAIVIPTIVDTEVFTPAPKANEVPVVGWIGTHSTYSFLESLFPVLERLARDQPFKLRVVGAGLSDIQINGVEVENLEWKLDREVEDFRSLDIGLYPITTSRSASEQWLLGKSGFKAIQYLAVGVPFVMSPIGVGAEIGTNNVTHFNAVTTEDWYNSLKKLIGDSDLRKRMGAAGREYSLENYSLAVHTIALARVIKSLFGNLQ